MKPIRLQEGVGIALYLGIVLTQFMQRGALADDQLLLTLPIAAFAIYLMTAQEQVFLSTGIGMGMAAGGLMWELAIFQAQPKMADDIMVITGFLVLVGVMLLVKSRRLSTGWMMGLGWGSLGVMWLSLRVSFGPTLLLLLASALVVLRLTPTVGRQQAAPTPPSQ